MLVASFVIALAATLVALWSALSAQRSAHAARHALALQQRSFDLTHRPYIAVTRTVGDFVAPEESTVPLSMIVTNAGKVPGRITSHSTTYVDDETGFVEALTTPLLRSDIVYPNEEIQAGVETQRGRRVIDRIEYEDLESQNQYWFEIEYLVPGFPPHIIRKEAN